MATIETVRTAAGEARYAVRIRRKGQPVVKKRFRRLADAQSWAREVELEIDRGTYQHRPPADRHPVGELLDLYLARRFKPKNESDRRARSQQLAWWRAKVGELPLSSLTPGRLAGLRDELAAEPIGAEGRQRAPRTVQAYLMALSACLTYGVELEWLPDNPIRRVRKPKVANTRCPSLSPVERAALLDACGRSQSPTLYALVACALSSGARRGELLALTWRDLDLAAGAGYARDTKNGETRGLVFAGPALEALRELHRRYQASPLRRLGAVELVFADPDTGACEFPTKAWRVALRRAGLVGRITYHDLRHLFASEAARGGASALELAALLGHRQLSMVKRYAHLRSQDVAPVARRAAEALLAPLPAGGEA